jgi:protein-L-isoaspartate(D-aspartate) O-methyltransferase
MDKGALLNSLKKQGFSDEIISAFEKVKRETFVPNNLIGYSYDDVSLPVEQGSTLSQPSTIALMLKLLEPKQNQKILEIGSGSGYVLALISEIIKNGEIYGIEINKNLAIKSKSLLSNNSNIDIFSKSGEIGLSDFAPYDRIIVSASCPDMRIPFNLLEQLSDNGILVVPVKQSLFQIKKLDGKTEIKEFPGFSFVDLKTGD